VSGRREDSGGRVFVVKWRCGGRSRLSLGEKEKQDVEV
jgi:hypothetical protein